MSISFSPGKLRGEQSRNMVEAVQKQMQAAAILAVGEVLMACLDTEVTVKLGREKGAPRQISEQPREIDIVSLSKGGGPAASRSREHEKFATKKCDSIVHEDAELGGRVYCFPSS